MCVYMHHSHHIGLDLLSTDHHLELALASLRASGVHMHNYNCVVLQCTRVYISQNKPRISEFPGFPNRVITRLHLNTLPETTDVKYIQSFSNATPRL